MHLIRAQIKFYHKYKNKLTGQALASATGNDRQRIHACLRFCPVPLTDLAYLSLGDLKSFWLPDSVSEVQVGPGYWGEIHDFTSPFLGTLLEEAKSANKKKLSKANRKTFRLPKDVRLDIAKAQEFHKQKKEASK